MALSMTTDWADVLSTVKRHCSKCGEYKDAPMLASEARKAPATPWVCSDCRETMAEGMPEDKGPVVGDPD